jgi:hypothetical protein
MEGLIDTRNEYIEHIQDILSIAISKRIYALYTETIEDKKGIKGFQNELYNIRKWNNNIVSDEYKKIVKYTKCKYLSNLIKIIIITTIKIKIYEYKEQFDSIKIKIPNPEDFVHKCYIHAASFSWKNAYLYNRNNIKDAEYQNNLNIIEENIRAIIKKTFRDFIPFDEIFKQIEDNLTDSVKQFKDNDDDQNIKTKDIKKYKKSDKNLEYEDEEDQEDEEDEDEEDEDEEGQEDEDEDEDEDEEGQEDEDEDEDEEGQEDEDNEDEDEDEEDQEDEEGQEDEKGHEDEEDEEDDKEDDNNNVNEENNEGININDVTDLVYYQKEEKNKIHTEDNYINKINQNNIVDISLKNSNDEYTGDINKNEENGKEISFTKSEQTNTQTSGWINEKENNIYNKWDTLKNEYNELSQNKVGYKKYENEIVSKKYNDDDTKSVSSVASNNTDISQIKKIHINETTNKNKKPSFF